MQHASTPPRIAALYVRQSLDKALDGLAVERQLEDCETRTRALGWTIGKVFPDNDVSASSTKPRPEYLKMLEALEAGTYNAVVVWDLDRLTRRPIEIEHFIDLADRKNIALASVGGDVDLSTDNGRLFARIKGAVARAEVERKSARQKRAELQRAQSGLPHISHRPYGYDSDGMTIRPDEAEALQLMRKLLLAGTGYHGIAIELNLRGYTTTASKVWHPLTVRKVLSNVRYKGVRSYNGEEYEAQWPAIFTAEEFDHMQLVMRNKRELAGGRPVPRKFLLTGLVFCGRCGVHATGSRMIGNRDKKVRRVYRCLKPHGSFRANGCGSMQRNADALEEFIRQLVVFRLDGPKLAELLVVGDHDQAQLSDLLTDRMVKIDRKIALADDYSDGTFTKDEYLRQKDRLDSSIHEIDQAIGALQRGSVTLDVDPGIRIAEAWEKNDDNWRRQLLDMLIDRIELMPSNTSTMTKAERFDGKWQFRPSDVKIVWKS